MSFNPNTGLMYIPTTPTSNYSYSVVPNFNPQPPCMNAGVPGFACPEAGPAPAAAARGGAAPPAAGPMIGPAVPQGARGGFLMAWDPVKQKEAWRGAGGAGGGGGTVTTAGNLVFQVIQQGGRLVAYSADKGELLLDISTGQTGNMGPPITYMLDGKQYVTLLGGNPCGGGGSGPPPITPGPLPSSAIPGNVQMNVPVPGGAPGPGGYAETAPCGTPVEAPAAAGGRGGNAAPPLPVRMYSYVLDGKATQ
jgi:quinohemoprotein ethanol dehydrogenase